MFEGASNTQLGGCLKGRREQVLGSAITAIFLLTAHLQASEGGDRSAGAGNLSPQARRAAGCVVEAVGRAGGGGAAAASDGGTRDGQQTGLLRLLPK